MPVKAIEHFRVFFLAPSMSETASTDFMIYYPHTTRCRPRASGDTPELPPPVGISLNTVHHSPVPDQQQVQSRDISFKKTNSCYRLKKTRGPRSAA